MSLNKHINFKLGILIIIIPAFFTGVLAYKLPYSIVVPEQSTEHSSKPSVIASCGQELRSGKYVLEQDLIVDGQHPCVTVMDLNNFEINCKGFAILVDTRRLEAKYQIIVFRNLQHFKFINCRVSELNGKLRSENQVEILIENSSEGLFSRNQIDAPIYVFAEGNKSLIFGNNKITSGLASHHSENVVIQDNELITTKESGTVYNMVILGGKNNKVMRNIIDGGSDGIRSNEIGADDGILIEEEFSTLLESNIIRNHWDCGIEVVKLLESSIVRKNLISNQGVCGIGGWWHVSLKGNEFSDNVVDDSPLVFDFFRTLDGLRENEKFVYFLDNIFFRNKVLDSKNNGSTVFFNFENFREDIWYEKPILPENVKLGNNVFKDNDFGHTDLTPEFRPPSMVVDGGGNKCTQNYSPYSALKCEQ